MKIGIFPMAGRNAEPGLKLTHKQGCVWRTGLRICFLVCSRICLLATDLWNLGRVDELATELTYLISVSRAVPAQHRITPPMTFGSFPMAGRNAEPGLTI